MGESAEIHNILWTYPHHEIAPEKKTKYGVFLGADRDFPAPGTQHRCQAGTN